MPTTRDYYEILSIDRTADGEEIKRAYRRLAMPRSRRSFRRRQVAGQVTGLFAAAPCSSNA